ncbi:VCBS repeat-containing protein [Aureisphaera galaxeae]|uniref:VCBS repeat-containing protein n=1 Tax=Aureisphaera galaxeae TaxID=1538023 RepID=UPI0023510441|nr:VCBS repeat-containing protein [Aureisphaera galaxeae]MDC8003000.1 VCBS repeat-containing protein [Aureisphaera galaxeae]
MNRVLLLVFGLLSLVGCQEKAVLFDSLESEDTGLIFENTITETDDLNIIDYLYFYNGGGVAVGDINVDGLPDIFLSGNQVGNKLYLNKGNFQFEDITEKAGVAGNSTWNTGAVMGDVNGDGLLDIYVCAVVGILGFDGHNELYINNGDDTFTESSAAYGLDHDSYSSNATFLDYDLDGDLDIYLLNHAVHTQESFGKVDLRYKRNYETGDKLLRNDGGTFTDVSEEAGIYGGVNSYGLGLAVSDFNNDGWPDLYIGNDFHEDDYYYINNQDGTFTDQMREYFGHTSRFSMGNDVADVNRDGWPDLISLDMLPEDEKVLKASEGDDNFQILKLRTENYGYHYQYTRNMLFLNQQGYDYTETAPLSGVAATDWSWSALFADFDQDSEQDLFISNGIAKRPNDLDYINFVSNEQIQKKMESTRLMDKEALELMPKGNVPNYIFKGMGNASFSDESERWIQRDSLISGASALADFDGDGDLDIITHNLNRSPIIYANKTDDKANYLKLSLNYNGKNPFGIGTKVFSYHNGIQQYKEMYTVRGFQASSEPIIHFGYGETTKVDSLKIVWPNGTYQVITNVDVNQKLDIQPEGTQPFDYNSLKPSEKTLFEKAENNLYLDFTHEEDPYINFHREKLIPYQVSDRGPATAVGDFNGDGTDDIFFGGSKFKEAQMFMQGDTAFAASPQTIFTENRVTEDIDAVVADFNKDGKNDLFVGTGGGDFSGTSPALLDALYTQSDTTFIASNLLEMFQNASVVAAEDYDGDGDMDLFIGNQTLTNRFGTPGESYFLKNEGGTFQIDPNNAPMSIGMITDAHWVDVTGDGVKDLVVVGEWMSPTLFENVNGTFTQKELGAEPLNGLWQSLTSFDIDSDGDQDLLLGNWGENSKFIASENSPMKMYLYDFDKNGRTETIVATQKNGNYYPLEDFDELTSQLVFLKKKFPDYKSFAGQTIENIFEKGVLSESTLLEVHTLKSGYLKNNAGSFEFVPFDNRLQVSPILSFCTFDFDNDNQKEVLAAGNYFGIKPYHGRLDSFSGALIENENPPVLGHFLGLDLAQKSVRHLNIIEHQGNSYLLVTFNNEKAEVYLIKKP